MSKIATNIQEEFNSIYRPYQASLFAERPRSSKNDVPPFSVQLLKWVGNKQRFAHEIISHFPAGYNTYIEPFLGSGAILGTLSPSRALASDVLKPLIGIWQTLSKSPDLLVEWYKERWEEFQKDRDLAYEKIKAHYNASPNPADLFFLSRTCYGGVIRFRKDGYMSTPIGIHNPVPPEAVVKRVATWQKRTLGAKFCCTDFEETIEKAREGDLIYCDPPYSDTQAILYGAQSFSLKRLFTVISGAKEKGAFIVLSIDGHKKSGAKICDIPIPDGLFERSVMVHCGKSMLRRFQMEGESLESEVVSDRLFLSWS